MQIQGHFNETFAVLIYKNNYYQIMLKFQQILQILFSLKPLFGLFECSLLFEIGIGNLLHMLL